MATINLTQLKKEKEAKPASSFNNAPTIVLNKGKSSVETPRTNYDFSDRTAEPVQRKTLQTPVVTAPQTTTVNQQINRPAQQDQYGFWDNAGYVVEQAGKGLQGGIGGLVNAASTFLDKPLQTVNAIGSFGSKFSTSNDYSQYDPTTAEALRQKDAEIEQLRRQMYGNLDENFLDPIAQKGVELGAGMIAESQESNYDRDKLSMISRFGGDVAKAVGGMAPSIAASVIATPFAGAATASTIGLSVMGTGAYGQSLQQALNDGASYDDAVVYGLASAGVEIATEKLFGGIPFFGEGAVDDVLKEWMQAKLGTGTGKKVVEYLVDSIGEGAEEYISEVAGEFLVDIYTDERKDKDFFDRLMDVQDDAFYSFLLGAVTGGVMGAPGTILQSIKSGKTQEQSAESQTTPTEKDPMKAMINEDAKAEAQKIVADMGQSTPVNNYVAEGLKSDNVAVKMEAQKKNAENIRKSAKKLNIDKQVEEIIQVSNKLGKTIEFTEDLVDQKAWGANTGEKIILSKKSGDMIQQIFVHELTHDAENSQLYSELETELSNLAAVNGVDITALTEQIIRDYAEQGVSLDDIGARSEVNARIAQEYLFKESGIKQLANTNLSLAQKVFNWVRSLRIKLSGTEAEKQLLKTEQLYKKAIKDSKVKNNQKSKHGLPDGEFTVDLDYSIDVNNVGDSSSYLNRKKIDRSSVYEDALKNIKELFGNDDGVATIKSNGRKVKITKAQIKHGLLKNSKIAKETSFVSSKIGNVIKNAYKINEFLPDDSHAENQDIYLSVVSDSAGNIYPVRLIVDRNTSMLDDYGIIDKLYAAKAYKKETAGLQPLASGNDSLTSTISSTITLRQLSDIVKDRFGDTLPNVILEDLGYERPQTELSGRVKYALPDEVETRRKDLMAVHNLSDTKLKKSLELGGMPYPSIAVTKDTVGHDQFGDISLVFGQQTIDPEDSKYNRVYPRDAYTPTFPTVEYKLKEKEVEKANKYLKGISEKVDLALRPRNFLNEYKGDISTTNTIDDLWDKAKRDDGLKAVYLESIGNHVEPIYELKKGGPLHSEEAKAEYDEWHKTLSDEEFNDLHKIDTDYFLNKHGYESIDNLLIERAKKQRGWDNDKATAFIKKWPNFKKIMALDNAMRYLNTKDVVKPDEQVFDYQATHKLIEDSIDQSDYKDWVYDTFGKMFGKPGIRNNKEYITKNGNRRTFDQLHDEYTAESVLNFMRSQPKKGASNTPNLNAVFAAASDEFKSIKDIIENEDALSSESELITEQFDNLQNRFEEIRIKHTVKEGMSGYEMGIIDNNFMHASVEAFSKKYSTDSVIKKFKEYGFNLSTSDANELINIIKDSKQLGTDYFEAKPERIVGFDEVNAAVIPNTLSDDIKQMLRERGVNMVEYDPSVEGDRKRVMNSLEDSKFAIGGSILERSKDPAVRARAQMEKRIRHTFLFNKKSNPLKMYDVTSRIEDEFERTGKISDDLRKELFTTAYEETLRSSDVSYKELPEFKQMLQEDLSRAVSQYENTLIKERELKKFAEENDIDVSEVRLNPTTGFLKNVKPQDLPDKIISYKKLKASLKSDLINQVDNYAGGKVIDELIDKAAIEIVEDGFISSPTKFEIRQEMIKNGYSINAEAMNDNKELYDFIKSTKFNVPRGFGREIQDFDRTKKTLKTSTQDGQSIDKVYQELRSRFGEFFPDDLTNPADQYQQIADVMAELEPTRLMLEDSEQYNAEMRQYLEDTFTDRLEDFKNQVLYRSQKDYYDRAAKKQVAYDEAMNQVSEKISEKFFKENKDIDELQKSEHVIKSASIEDLSEVIAKIQDRGALSKTLAQNLDAMANGDVILRSKLSEIFEKPLREAKKTYVTNQKRVLNDVYKRIVNDLGIKMGSKESAAMMWYGEGQKQLNKVKGKVESDKLEFTKYTLDDLKKDFPKTWQNIVEADKIMRKYYDEYVDRINESLEKVYSESVLKESVNERRTQLQKDIREAQERLEQLKAQRTGEVGGPDLEARINAQRKRITDLSRQFNNVAEDVYRNKRLKKRSDYYHHFQEIGFAENIQQILNVDNANNIANALAGISEYTKPKSKWEKFMQRRSNVARYEEDAIKGFLKYSPAAEYKISFDPYVAQMRGTIQDMIKLSDEANLNNAKAINWLTNYTNSLAGKTNPMDRWLAHTESGRTVLQLLNKVNSRVKANAVVGNLNSAVSQFYNLPNGLAVLTDAGGAQSALDVAKGSADYSAYAAKKISGQDVSDNPINQSVFLAERYIDSTIDQFDERIMHKPAQAATFLLTFGDQVVAEQLWFSAYEQGMRLGKHDPVAYADDLVSRSVAGRGIGEVPLMQQSQVVKLIAPFQVEVNNAYQLMKQLGAGALKDKEKLLSLAIMYGITWIMNEVNEALTGNRVGMDIFNAMQDAVENWDTSKNPVTNTFNAAGRLTGEILSNVPMGAQLAQMVVSDEYDREKLFGEADPSRYGTGNIGVNALMDPAVQLVTGQNVDWQSLVTNFATPMGGKQLNRFYNMAEDAGIIPRIDFNRDDKLLINGNAVGKDSEGNDVPFNEIKWEEFFKDTKSGSYNDKGGLKYPIDTSNPINMAKGFAFGTYATKEGKEYIKEGYSALSKQTTEKYEDLVKDSAKNYSDAKTYYDYFRQKEDNSYANAELLNQKAMQDAIKKIIEEGPTETDENGIVTSKYDYSDFGTTEKAMKAYAGAIAKGIDFNIIEEASKIKSVQKQDGERDSKAITHSAAALVRKFYEEKGIYKKIVDYCNHSKDTDVTAFGLATKVLDDAYYKKVLSEIEKVRKGKR